MIGIIFVRLLAFIFRSAFVVLSLTFFIFKTVFMWFFFFEKPAKTYAEWLEDALRHVRSDAYPARPIPKMKFINIIDGDTDLITIRREDDPERIIIKSTPFSWLSLVILPFFLISSLHLMVIDDIKETEKIFQSVISLFMYVGIVIVFIWISIFSFKRFSKRIFEESQQ